MYHYFDEPFKYGADAKFFDYVVKLSNNLWKIGRVVIYRT
jgi:hypothetical protein